MAYGDYLKTISSKFESLFAEIAVGYNFDYGDEFEIALCKVLRVLLPSKFGVCRGFVVTETGEEAGDDIIIFDHERFPTLRLLESNDYGQKQKIPVEAVYCYIEAKHSIHLDEAGSETLFKAAHQVSVVKSLKREKVPLTQISPTVNIATGFRIEEKPWWPDYKNPLYTAIITRHFTFTSDSSAQHLKAVLEKVPFKPDLLILGSDHAVVPTNNHQIYSPFLVENSRLEVTNVQGTAFALGMSSMCWALEEIQLGTISWPVLIQDALRGE